MKIKKTSLFAMLMAAVLIVGVTTTFATSASDAGQTPSIPNTAFTHEEYEKLTALQFDGYENMTVADYQEKVWTTTDTPEYITLLERMRQDNTLYELRDTNETASFLFYILSPLTAQKWQTQSFGGFASTNYEASDNASLEYLLTMSITDADRLTVLEYNNTRLKIVNAILFLLQEMSLEELQTDQTEKLQEEITSLAQKNSSDCLQLSIEFRFMPLSGYEEILTESNTVGAYTQEQEARQNGYGTAEDYTSLLALKTSDYQQMSVTEFNAAVLEWANEHFDGWERILEDAGRNDYQVNLTDEERSFVALTVMLSGVENGRMIQSLKTGRPEEDCWAGGYNLTKQINDNGRSAWCNFYYQFPYKILDKDKLTVEERDRCIYSMLHAIQTFWEETPLEDLLKLTKPDIIEKMRSFAKTNSSNFITIKIDESQVQFEGMDERNYNFN